LSISNSSIVKDGLWSNNPALVQLLGLCPLMAVSTSVATSLGLGLTTLLVLTSSNFVISCLRKLFDEETRLPVQILIIASFVTLADLALQFWFFELHQRIGLFVALIVTNCTLLGRAEAFASRNPIKAATLDGLMMGTGFLLVLLVMGGVRELFGQGTLFAGLDALTGLPDISITVSDSGFLLMMMPPGAFITLGCLIALKNVISQRSSRKSLQPSSPTSQPIQTRNAEKL
jgi:electron transport complex protein RnfE